MKASLGVAAIVCCLTALAMGSSITEVFSSFGDSLRDDGKFGQLDPLSFEGRFSNGVHPNAVARRSLLMMVAEQLMSTFPRFPCLQACL